MEFPNDNDKNLSPKVLSLDLDSYKEEEPSNYSDEVELQSFLAYISKISSEEEKQKDKKSDYYERRRPEYMDISGAGSSFSYGENSSAFGITEEESRELHARNRARKSSAEHFEKNMDALEKMFSRNNNSESFISDSEPDEGLYEEDDDRMLDLDYALSQIEGYNGDLDDEDYSEDNNEELEDYDGPEPEIDERMLDIDYLLSTMEDSEPKSKKKTSTKKTSAKKSKKTSGDEKTKKRRVKFSDMNLPQTGSVIYIDLNSIKPVSWKDVVERKGRIAYHMTPVNGAGWFIKRTGNDGPSAYVVDRDEALELAKKYAQREKCTLKVHNSKGTIEDSFSFGHTTKK